MGNREKQPPCFQKSQPTEQQGTRKCEKPLTQADVSLTLSDLLFLTIPALGRPKVEIIHSDCLCLDFSPAFPGPASVVFAGLQRNSVDHWRVFGLRWKDLVEAQFIRPFYLSRDPETVPQHLSASAPLLIGFYQRGTSLDTRRKGEPHCLHQIGVRGSFSMTEWCRRPRLLWEAPSLHRRLGYLRKVGERAIEGSQYQSQRHLSSWFVSRL